MTVPQRVHARRALLPDGWVADVEFTVTDRRFTKIERGVPASVGARRANTVVPGIANLHSHAFQRILAGAAERRDGTADTFMSWRSAMYSALERLTPELVTDIYTYVYARMLRFGYTNVAEFHYVHRDIGGKAYANPAELSLRAVAAARRAGIGITHLPVVYQHGGFGKKDLSALQARLRCTPEMAAEVAGEIRATFRHDIAVGAGLAPHSLRAVDHSDIARVAALAKSVSPQTPLHIHVSEQIDEVRQSIEIFGANPIQLLAASTELDASWVLVHCTHATPEDFALIAGAGATVALCPMTEANLGDGHVNLTALMASKALYGIGSDSQAALAPHAEWLMLEFPQRLLLRERNVASHSGMSVGRTLVEASSASAEASLGRKVGRLASGHQADILELETDDPAFIGFHDDQLLDAWIFAANQPVVKNVMVAGDWVVNDGVHREELELRKNFATALAKLRG